MITEEAVYAAAEAVYGCGFDGSPQKEAWLTDFRKALEAAAPHIIAAEKTRRHEEALAEFPHDMVTTVAFDGAGGITKAHQPHNPYGREA